mmetsp:Transcript_6171/g.6443  ORF Transcript_6171/g.6443 Transcript_6171/m.6443 type:complete len:557 (-) Transcript_6171:101-1771(-)
MNLNSPKPPNSPIKSQGLISPRFSPRSQIVLLKCMKPSNNSASFVPLKEEEEIKQNNKGKKKEKIEEILIKENIRAVRSKRKEILTQKLVNKLGRNNLEKINKHVEQYLDKNVEISSDSFDILEKLIKEDIQQQKQQQQQQQGGGGSSGENSQVHIPKPLSLENSSDKIQNNEINHGSNSINVSIPPLPPGDEWRKLTFLQSLEDKNTQLNENNYKIEKTQLLSNALLQQINHDRQRKLKEREENIEFGERVKEDSERFKQECEIEKMKHIELNKKTKLMWDDQLSYLTKQKQLEKENEKNEKERKLQQLQQEAEEIERENLKRKHLEERRVQLIKKEYEEKRREREYLRLKEKEDDKRMTIENQKQYEREENERKRQFQARLNNIENRIHLAEDGPIRISLEEERRENEIILKHIQEKDELEKKLFEEKKRNYLQTLKDINETNLKLMNDKFNRINEERMFEKQIGEQSKKLGQQVLQETRLSIDKKRIQQQQYRDELLKQIEEQSYQKIVLQRDMNMIERSMNSKDLQRIEKDPVTAQKVAEFFSKSSPKRKIN